MQNVASVNSVQHPVVSFKRQEHPYNPQAGIPSADRYQPAQQKQKSQKDGWSKASVIFSGILALSFAGLLGAEIYKLRGKGAGEIKDNLMDAITDVKMTFRDCRNTPKKCVDLDSETTSKPLRDKFMNLVNIERIIPESKAWSGTQHDAANFLYLYGFGGTGKTYVAEQYAEKIGALFASIKYPDLGSPYKDAASMKVNNFFNKLIEYAKAHKDQKIVICIDECDALIRKIAEGSHGAEEASKTRAAVLTGLDKLYAEADNVTVIMTSNYHPESGLIDDVVKRRLNNCIEVPLPETNQRLAMLKLGLKDVGAIQNKDEFFASPAISKFVETDLDKYSNGEIMKICEEARKIFEGTLKDVPKEDLTVEKHPFLIDYLLKGKELKGRPASLTNSTMQHPN